MTDYTALLAEVAETEEALQFAEETLGEVRGEHYSECALYGDSWPGALLDISSCEKRVARIKADLQNLYYELRLAFVGPVYVPQPEELQAALDDLTADIPF